MKQLTWIPGRGNRIKIWEDSIMGEPSLATRDDLTPIRNWMSMNKICLLSIFHLGTQMELGKVGKPLSSHINAWIVEPTSSPPTWESSIL
jgi:hypothetical protein